MYKGIQYRC